MFCFYVLLLLILFHNSIYGDCPSSLITCSNNTGIHSPSCCGQAFPAASEFCCPANFPNCGDSGCCPNGSPIHCKTSNKCCPSGTHCGSDGSCVQGIIGSTTCDSDSSCGIGVCCSTSGGKLCCPFEKGTCCGDACCPSGYACGVYNGTNLCQKTRTELNVPLSQWKPQEVIISDGHMQFKNNLDDQTYAFVPLSDEVKTKCTEEASKMYCSQQDVSNAEASCMMKMATGYCAVSPESCWRVAPLGGSCASLNCQNPTPNTCDWYLGCLQQKFKCSVDSYPLTYGLFYCQRFKQYQDSFNEEGKMWINRVMLCLQRALLSTYNAGKTSCEEIKTIAFESHPKCYVEGNPSFCDVVMNPKNMMALWKVYRMKDLFSLKGSQQMAITAAKCAPENTLMYLLYTQIAEQSI